MCRHPLGLDCRRNPAATRRIAGPATRSTPYQQQCKIYAANSVCSQPSATQPNPAQPSPTQRNPTQPNPAQPSATQHNPTQPSATQPSATQPNPAQPSATQPNPAQPNPAQPSATLRNPTQRNPPPSHIQVSLQGLCILPECIQPLVGDAADGSGFFIPKGFLNFYIPGCA